MVARAVVNIYPSIPNVQMDGATVHVQMDILIRFSSSIQYRNGLRKMEAVHRRHGRGRGGEAVHRRHGRGGVGGRDEEKRILPPPRGGQRKRILPRPRTASATSRTIFLRSGKQGPTG